jgi:DNA-binding MarR family transcriptional regulator
MVTTAAMTHRLTRLEDKGLLERRTDLDNRRSVLVNLTAEGLRLVDEIVEGHLENERRLLAPLSREQQDLLARLLERFLAGSGDSSRRAEREP